jgi:hypothetical protein
MKIKLLLTAVAVVLGLLSGPSVQPMLINRLPDIGGWTLVIMVVIAALVPPATLVLLSMGERYQAMAHSWSVLFFVALLLLSANLAALIWSAQLTWSEPASYLLLAWGSGILASLSLIKLWLLRISARKAARAAAMSEVSD